MDYNKIIETYLGASYDAFTVREATLMKEYPHILPWTAVVIYLAMVFLLPKIIKKPIPGITAIMGVWNLLLTIYSITHVAFTTYLFSDIIQKEGIWGVFCDPDKKVFSNGPLIFWFYLFALSKFFELLDTLWMILKSPNRKVAFLHWYHHATVLVFAWYAIKWEFTAGLWFGYINAIVHSIMYFYYFLTCIGFKPPFAIFITLIQILQMIIGLCINGYWIYSYSVEKHSCAVNQPELVITSAIIIYGSYLYLFVKFFINRYLSPKEQLDKKGKKKEE